MKIIHPFDIRKCAGTNWEYFGAFSIYGYCDALCNVKLPF